MCGDRGTASQSKGGSAAQDTCPGAQEVRGGGGGVEGEGWRDGGMEGWKGGEVKGWRE